MSRPIIPVFVSYLSGLIAGYYLNIPLHIIIASALTLTSLATVSILLKRLPVIFLILSMLSIATLGIGRMEGLLNPFSPGNDITNFLSDEPLSLEGRIYEPPGRLPDKTRLYLELSALYTANSCHPITGKLLLTIGRKETGLKYGDRIRFLADIRKPRNFHNPGGFDYERHLALKGVFAAAYLKDEEGIIKISEDNDSMRSWIERMRGAIRGNTNENGGGVAPILLALTTGEQGEIPKGVRESFSRAGTAHILAISGEHIGIIALISFAIVLYLLKRSERIMLAVNAYKVAALMTIPGIALYSLIAGSGFSTIRAAIMGGTALIAVLSDRRKDVPSLIAFTALLILALEPEALFDISFQLSFASVISLAIIFPYLREASVQEPDDIDKPWNIIDRLSSWLKLMLLITLAVTIGTAPIVAYYFNRISLISPISNLMIVPFVGFIIVPIGLLSAILTPVSSAISGWLVSINSLLLSFVIKLTDIFASFSLSSVRVVTPNLFEIAIFYLFIILFIYRKVFKWAGRLIIPIILLIVSVEFFYLSEPWIQNNLKVTFLDVGQGESALIEFPGGKRMLIDGGGIADGDFDIGERVVAPFLWHNRIGRIDYLVLSHPNSDHYGGLPFILRNFKVNEIWESGVAEGREGYMDFIRAGQESRALHRNLSDGDSLVVSGVTIDALNPPKGYVAKDDRMANNGSLALMMRYGNTSFLFTGDMEKEAEYRLLSKGDILKSTVIKVPHHGSFTSSTTGFLGKALPEKAIFSVGYKNRFGFPKYEIVQRYREIGAEIYRTDRDGAIVAISDGTNTRCFKTYQPLSH